MDELRQILIVDDQLSRQQQLTTVLDFIGESCQNISLKELENYKESASCLCIVVGDTQIDPEQLITEYPALPFLTLGQNIGAHVSNHIGNIEEPFNYRELTQQLHFCQTYLDKIVSGQKTGLSSHLFRSLVGKGGAIQEVRHLIEQVAVTSANVLVLGESGTGKEVVARGIHDASPRASGPFVPVNCGAIPAELLESELFGHEKGAFTGAFAARKGRFELADGGSLFLDEIGDMPMPMQVKLLRVLQERTFERVGGSKAIKVDVRVIAATHRNLEEMIREGSFREDLFYRLNVFPIETPALRQRQDDIPLLLQELIGRHEEAHHASVRFTQRSIESLMLHAWPGNVRELSNLIERLLILHPNRIVDVNDLPPKYRHLDAESFEPEIPDEIAERDALAAMFTDEPQEELMAEAPETVSLASSLPEEGLNLKDMLSELEVDMIRQALDQQSGVVARAADQLGMRRTTLVEKMRKYGLSKEG